MSPADEGRNRTRRVAQRILSLKRPDETDSSFARRIGVSPQVVSNYRSEANGASLEVLAQVVERTSASAHWLLTGRGSRVGPVDEGGSSVSAVIDRVATDMESLLADLRTRYGDDAGSSAA